MDALGLAAGLAELAPSADLSGDAALVEALR